VVFVRDLGVVQLANDKPSTKMARQKLERFMMPPGVMNRSAMYEACRFRLHDATPTTEIDAHRAG
jgi:hypothetical protein